MKKTWQDRLVKESDKLGKKLDSLTAFIGGDKDSPFCKLKESDRDILVAQHSAMHVYHNILDIRMKRLGLKDCIDDINTTNVKKGFFESFNAAMVEKIDPIINKPVMVKKAKGITVFGPFESFEEMMKAVETENKNENEKQDEKEEDGRNS